MSVDPGSMETGSDPQDATMDFDEESTLDDNEVLDPIDEGDTVNDPTASVYDTSWVPDDRPSHRTDFGNTLSEMREGESLDQRLGEDEPDLLEQELGDPVDQVLGVRAGAEDVNIGESGDARLATEAELDDPEVEALVAEAGGDTDVPAADFAEQDPRAGRLVEPDEGLESDTEKDMIAYDAGISGAGASAEEAAVHVVDDLPGATP
jgi:hypothetical protein